MKKCLWDKLQFICSESPYPIPKQSSMVDYIQRVATFPLSLPHEPMGMPRGATDTAVPPPSSLGNHSQTLQATALHFCVQCLGRASSVPSRNDAVEKINKLGSENVSIHSMMFSPSKTLDR